MKIAVVGTGISGLLAAHLLCEEHDITVFEAADYIGGHTHTVEVRKGGVTYAVDTGFIVYNDWTYPNFNKLLRRLNVAAQPSEMSFSVRCEKTGLEYNGTSLNALFAQRRNLFRPSFHRMIRDILRFGRESKELLRIGSDDTTLGAYLLMNRYSREFINQYIVPMGAAIWSADPMQMLDFPARYFVEFFTNHGMLSVNERPQWRTVAGGSSRYIGALTRPYADRIRLQSPVRSITRHQDRVEILSQPVGEAPRRERFDQVVLATHSDQALALLADPSEQERDILGAIPYQTNDTVLHTDASLLPRRRLAWASWNYHIPVQPRSQVGVTYYMNLLQRLQSPHHFCVTLNHIEGIDRAKVIRRITYHHPVYTSRGVAAQQRHAEISGVRRTHFCGAYWGFGFHEDGVKSALAVCRNFGKGLDS